MATSFAPLSISVGGSHLKSSLVRPNLAVQRKSNILTRKNLTSPLRAEYRDNRGGGGGGELLTGFILGGAIFGTLAYVFAPQIRRTVLDENEHGFQRARRPIYYDEEIESTKETFNEKIGQLNSAINNIYSRLRGNNNKVPAAAPEESDSEFEAVI
ncbi:uncharacterized protein LOC127138779 isoform X2 [Lathyrus oleraceus]|uniref:Uncharacterized protein n=1 Tax=Pisum sativum TaxID=3888 RepID=A0A9D5ANH0_PEA|nr:uncharacterized protein LOC127138779 isoform X2 [Pisum sativum]KAI5415463.1 hypothetical protein KIW84_040770 [Pisum sativum]